MHIIPARSTFCSQLHTFHWKFFRQNGFYFRPFWLVSLYFRFCDIIIQDCDFDLFRPASFWQSVGNKSCQNNFNISDLWLIHFKPTWWPALQRTLATEVPIQARPSGPRSPGVSNPRSKSFRSASLSKIQFTNWKVRVFWWENSYLGPQTTIKTRLKVHEQVIVFE